MFLSVFAQSLFQRLEILVAQLPGYVPVLVAHDVQEQPTAHYITTMIFPRITDIVHDFKIHRFANPLFSVTQTREFLAGELTTGG